MYSDQEIHQTINKITDTKSLFSMSGYSVKKSPYKNRRQEIIAELVKGINQQRIGTKYKPTTERLLAIKINRNPFLNEQELEYLLKECTKAGNYKKLFWILK